MRTKGTIFAVVMLALMWVPGHAAAPGLPLGAERVGPRQTADASLAVDNPLSSGNVSLVATVPVTGATGGRFVGNHFFMTASGTFPLAPGPTSGLYIFDASNAELPVPVGFLPLPHAENEDVDVSASRRLVLVSQDDTQGLVGGILYVISWADPSLPTLVGTLQLPESVSRPGGTTGGPGHIANCIADCQRYAYVTGAGNGDIFVVDLATPSRPAIAARIPGSTNKAGLPNNDFRYGTVHDVNTDSLGGVWVTGSGGTAQLNVASPNSPVAPAAVRWISPADNNARNQFIHHNSLKLDPATLLVTEEDWLQPECGGLGVTGEQGGFQTWRINAATGSGGLSFLDQWLPEIFDYTGDSAPAELFCSSHWFTFNTQKVVAVGWYNQGVRFLSVANPADIRQVGYLIAPGTMASGAYFAPGGNDVVWVVDYVRGIDVVKIAGGGVAAPAVVAPLKGEWFRAAGEITFKPSPTWGYACFVATP